MTSTPTTEPEGGELDMREKFTTMRDWDDKFSRATGLGHPTTVVGWYVKRFADYETGERVRPSTRRIAYETGIDVSRIRGVKGHLGLLVKAGWLVLVKPATPTAPAVYRLGIGAYRASWVESLNGGTSDAPGTSDVPGDGDAPGTSDAIPGVRDVQSLGVRVAQPDLSFNLPKTIHSCASTDVEHVSDTEPGLPIDLPDTPKPRTKTASKKTATTDLEAEFDTWWSDYPRKVARADALAAYVKVRKSGVTAETLTDALARQLPGMLANEEKFRLHGVRWLNRKRWEDPIAASGQGSGPNVHIRPWQPAADTPTGGPYKPSRALEAVMGSPARHDPSETLTDAYSART